MRVAYVYDAIYPDIPGGVERRIWEISKRLAKRGHDVHIFGMHLWNGGSIIQRDGVTIHGICRSYPLYKGGRRRIFPVIPCAVRTFFALLNEHFDIIDCQNAPYLSALAVAISSRISGSSLIITWHEVWGDYWYEYLGLYGSFGKGVERILARSSKHVIAGSETTRDDFRVLNPVHDMRIIPNGIDFAEITHTPPAGMKSDILFVGRLIWEKHVDVLIDAVSLLTLHHPGIRCIVIGDGPERLNLEMRARKKGVNENIVFTGFLKDSRDVISYMKSSRVFAFPSTREGFGISALEALACGLPIVTIDHPKNASRVFARGGCGVLSAPDPVDFARKIVEVMTHNRMEGDICRLKAREYDWEVIVDKIESYYAEVQRA